MIDSRWRQVRALFEATLERAPDERAVFLAAAAGGDEDLRREVQSLLESDQAAAGFTERLPARDVPPSSTSASRDRPSLTFTETEPTFAADEQVGPYRVIGLLGRGGMGEVYRAHDSKLRRDVALKMLPGAYALDADRLARFRREAHSLAALNHPHIAAIYGFEESNGRQALVLELVEGETLAARLREGPIPIVDALRIAGQIADAVHAAHAKGIVHRDLKPANIKVTRDGIVKVLDFGLAKAAGDALPTGSPQSAADSDHTRLGVVLGTAGYMSPEQARGLDVDTRADIWAFGCVLYEMLAGGRAFAADTAAGSITKILEAQPDWSGLPRQTPEKVRQLVRRCLQKDPANRPPTIAEAREIIASVLAPPSASRTWVAVAASALIAVAIAASVLLTAERTPIANRADWVQLTNLDSVTQPALSPDGRMLAFVRGASTFVGPGQLYLKMLPDGEPVALTSDDLSKMSPIFSPDGGRIAYTVNEGNSWDTWEVPTIRGEPRRWLNNASGLTWLGANDLLFSEIKTGRQMALVTSRHDRTDSRDFYVPEHENAMAHRSYASPDGKWVLAVEMDERGTWVPCRLVGPDGVPGLAGPAKASCTDAAWSPDGRWMYFSADAGDGFHLWRQRFRDGEPEQLTFGPTEEQGLAIAADGRSLITSVGLSQRSVWLHDANGDRQISLEGYAFFPLLSADGRSVLFRVTRGLATGQSPSELWIADLRSGQKRRLIRDLLVTGYDVSHDDRVVASATESDGQSSVWLAPLDGREPPRRIPGADGDNPRFGPDGEVYMRVTEGNAGALYRIRDNGDGRERITALGSHVLGTVSPDGRWISGVGVNDSAQVLFGLRGQSARTVYPNAQTSRWRWALGGTHASLSIQYGQAAAFALGRTYVLPVPPGAVFPSIPPAGFRNEADIAAAPGATILEHGDVALGSSLSVYAYSRVITTRNLYRIPLQ